MVTSPHIADITQQTFQSSVLAKSQEIPVLVDFWAAWCGPCKMLMPVLARLADEYRGKFFLAKVNTDVEQALAAHYGVKSLPTVKLFKNGQVVEGFLGVQPEKAIRALLDRHIPRESDTLIDNALLAMQAGKVDEAMTALQMAMESDPANDRAGIELARLLLQRGRVENAESVLDALSGDARETPAALALAAQLKFARIAAHARPVDALQQAIAANPHDSSARHELAARHVLQGEYTAALDELLEIVRTDRKFEDDAARKAMISIFDLLGSASETVRQYRRKLSLALN
jgi:putative thioredoxin